MSGGKVLVLDVDGVVSPVHGTTAWGDEVVAGWLFGPVAVSPEMCSRLDALTGLPGVVGLWLTDWDAEMRAAMAPFPGVNWAAVADPNAGRVLARERAAADWDRMPWWKWWMLDDWLDRHLDLNISTLVWCDDDLAKTAESEPLTGTREATRVDVCGSNLRARGISSLLIAPDPHHGLRPEDVAQIERALVG